MNLTCYLKLWKLSVTSLVLYLSLMKWGCQLFPRPSYWWDVSFRLWVAWVVRIEYRTFWSLNDDKDRYGHSPCLGILRRRRCSASLTFMVVWFVFMTSFSLTFRQSQRVSEEGRHSLIFIVLRLRIIFRYASIGAILMSQKIADGIRDHSGLWKHGHTYQVCRIFLFTSTGYDLHNICIGTSFGLCCFLSCSKRYRGRKPTWKYSYPRSVPRFVCSNNDSDTI